MKSPSTAAEAIQIQNTLRSQVRIDEDGFKTPLQYIAGVDVGYDPVRNKSKAAVVLLSWQEEIEIEEDVYFPYVPGLLSFREAPVAMNALASLKRSPDLVFVDGHGVAHPRGLGIAAHIGVLMDLPTIGVAKKKLCGYYTEPGLLRGAMSPLTYKGERIGMVLRSRDNVKPIFISPGHKVTMTSAVELVLQCLGKYKLPEPTRLADKLSKFRK